MVRGCARAAQATDDALGRGAGDKRGAASVAWVPENANVLTLTSGDGSVREEKASEAWRVRGPLKKQLQTVSFLRPFSILVLMPRGWVILTTRLPRTLAQVTKRSFEEPQPGSFGTSEYRRVRKRLSSRLQVCDLRMPAACCPLEVLYRTRCDLLFV